MSQVLKCVVIGANGVGFAYLRIIYPSFNIKQKVMFVCTAAKAVVLYEIQPYVAVQDQ